MSCAIVGLGGLGSSALITLIKSWEKDQPLEILLIDGDSVEISNLNRQILFNEKDIGTLKTQAALKNLETRLNFSVPRNIKISTLDSFLKPEMLEELLRGKDFILDCTDSVKTKVSLNNFCVLHGIPLAYAGVQGQEGIVFCIVASGPCLLCVFGDFSDQEIITMSGSCQEAGIVGASAALTAALQVERILSVIRTKDSLSDPGTNLGIRINKTKIEEFKIRANKSCPLCCSKYPRTVLHLENTSCPQTFLFSKLALEELPPNQYLELRFSSEEDQTKVEKSLEKEGHLSFRLKVAPYLSYHRSLIKQKD